MTRYLSSAILVGVLAVPAAAVAQHQAGGSPSTGTATSSAPAPSSSGGGGSTSSSSGDSGGSSAGRFGASQPSNGSGRRRGSAPATGTAVRRGSVPSSPGTVVVTGGSGFYPWGYGGAILGGEYFGGYYGAYDPWYGWYPTYAPPSYSEPDETGAVRLKVKPNDASVYVDGFFVGTVDDFDGVFQRLRLSPGPHHIEIRAPQHQPLAVDVMIQEDFTITYQGELANQ